jgi:predicted membrane-bound spermidine synthase
MATPTITAPGSNGNAGGATAAATGTEPGTPPTLLSGQDRTEALTLLATVFLVAACGLIYELLLATISAYLLGSSVTQFSLCIGAFIGAMGVGSYLSQFVQRGLLRLFLLIEVALGAVGGLSAWALFAAYTTGNDLVYYGALFGLLLVIGGLSGIELPLLTRLLNRYGALRTVIAQALSFDYVGALIGSVAFPLLLLPTLGTMRTAFLVGLLNIGVAAYNVWVFRHRLRAPALPLALCGALAALLAGGAVASEKVSSLFERRLYEDEIVLARQTAYQRIVLTRWRDDVRLFLDGHLQFSSLDEYRYHEALVHPALALSRNAEDVLLLGGGDGLGLREVLKHEGVRRVTLVDIDPAMTNLGARYPGARQTQQKRVRRQARARRPHGRLQVPGNRQHTLRRHHRRPARPEQRGARQTVLARVLPARPAAAGARRRAGHAGHLALLFAQRVLVHRGNARIGRLSDHAVPRLCAVVRRLGLDSGRARKRQ